MTVENPLDDILDEKHKLFMQNYIKKWPYPPMTQYHVGQTVNVERNGFLQRSKVLEIDCSLMEVVFLVCSTLSCSFLFKSCYIYFNFVTYCSVHFMFRMMILRSGSTEAPIAWNK